MLGGRGGTPSSHDGGGVPHPVMVGLIPHPVMVGGTPSSHGRGVPHLVMVGGTPSGHGGGQGYPGYLPTIQTWPGGYPQCTTPLSRPGQGYPGYPPPSRPGMGYPPPPSRPSMGYPPPRPGTGYPPPMVNRQTFPSINITFPHTTYAGSKNLGAHTALNCKGSFTLCDFVLLVTAICTLLMMDDTSLSTMYESTLMTYQSCGMIVVMQCN